VTPRAFPRRSLKRSGGKAQSTLRRTWRGIDHFKAYVWSSVVAHNLALFARLKPGDPTCLQPAQKRHFPPNAVGRVNISPAKNRNRQATSIQAAGKIPDVDKKRRLWTDTIERDTA